jgi:hypothetical protein
LASEKADKEELKKEIKNLKKYHYEELQKMEELHAEKYKQLK